MIGVLEAKDERHSPDAGLEQAKSYARLLDVPFAYSSNGHAFVEFDFFENKSRELDTFHAPDELWKRWWAARTGGTDPAEVAAKERLEYRMDPLHPFCPPSRSGKELRYFQEVAVRRVIERALRGQRRILLTMATTGTGKTFTAFQIVWKLKKSGWLRKPVLFIADHNVLRDQAYNAFSPFGEGQSDPRAVIEDGRIKANRAIKALGSENRSRVGLRASLPATLLPGPQPHRGSVLKAQGAALRKAETRTREALLEAMGRALDAVTGAMPQASSSIGATVHWLNRHDKHSRTPAFPMEGMSAPCRSPCSRHSWCWWWRSWSGCCTCWCDVSCERSSAARRLRPAGCFQAHRESAHEGGAGDFLCLRVPDPCALVGNAS
jgi:hypothetical protein